MSEQNFVKWKENSRILYVEPNDVYGHVNGVPMTPDYSDYCVSVNLIAEVVPRQKHSGGDQTKTYCMTWTQPPKFGDDGEQVTANNWISFLKGEDAKVFGGPKDESFLTTYYTDINFDDVVKKNIVEGLGIESVQVSFESYYTPTIVIKFVDVRGSSLFGREEVVHDSNEDLSSDSVFGVFFTTPYPKFKLQIKGFYGHAVTYQLTCSDFKSSFNSKTGNFEATATFIGYSYSLLTDIPLRYLVAAPYCDYVGREYWEKKLNSPEWALSDGNQPKTLFRIVQKVRSLLSDTDKLKNKIMSDDDANTKSSIETEKSLLRELGIALSNYIKTLSKLNQTEITLKVIKGEENEEQLIIFGPSPDTGNLQIEVGENFSKASVELEKAFNSYNTAYPLKEFNTNLLPNGKRKEYTAGESIEFSRLCKHIERESDGKIKNIVFRTEEKTVESLMKLTFNDDVKLTKKSAQRLIDDSSSLNGTIPKYFGEFCYIVNFNGFNKKIKERIAELDKKNNEIDKRVAQKLQSAAAMDLGFTPCIGDVFKIIMCHLETFIHMMWECYRVIDGEGDLRSPESLGVDLSKTDIPKGKDGNLNIVHPWPGLFDSGKETGQGGDIDESINYITWVGDLNGNNAFEEEKLVKSIYKACQDLDKKHKDDKISLETVSGLPIMPNDLNNLSTVFDGTSKSGISALSGYLSFRAAQIFGIMMNEVPTPELAKTLGVMDAYNYFNFLQSRSEIKNNLIEPTSNKGTLSDIMTGVAHCEKPTEEGFYATTYQETDRSIHDFEIVRGINYKSDNVEKKVDRHPMFVKNGHNSKYVHYYTTDYVGLVPDRIKSYDSYETTFKKVINDDNLYFTFTKDTDKIDAVSSDGFLYKPSTRSLLGSEDLEYINTDMFDVNINDSDDIIAKYEEMKSGNFKVLGETYTDDLTNVIDKFWHIGNDEYGKYIGDEQFMLSLNTSDRGISEDELYPKSAVDANKGDIELINFDNDKIFNLTNGVRYDKDKNAWVTENNTEKAVSNLCVRFLQSNYLTNTGYGYESLFSSDFYYHQNDFITNDNEEKDKQNRVKALLFLHSLKYDYKQIAGFLNSSKKNGGFYSVPLGYMLLLGGLLWRQKYYNKYGNDPIQTSKSGCKYKKYVNGNLTDYKSNNKYKEIGINYTLFRELDSKYVLCPLKNSDNASYMIKVSKLFGINDSDNWMPDEYVTNRLVRLFDDFVNYEWSQKLVNGLELKDVYFDEKNNRNIINFYGDTFNNKLSIIINDFKLCKNNDEPKIDGISYIVSECKTNCIAYRIRNYAYFANFYDNYRYISVNNENKLLMLLNDENTEIQDTLKYVFTKKVIVCDTSGIRHYYNTESKNVNEIEIKTETLKSYFSGFESKIKELSEETDAIEVDGYDDDYVTYNRDLLLPIYLYLKMIWDKWLISTTTKKYKSGKTVSYEDYYNVENFYNSFVFIDAFYKNIYKKFIINLETLKDSYEGRDADGSLFQFIGDITKSHNCLFLALPDYVDMGNADNKTVVRNLMDIFTPLPYNKMNAMEDENRFVIIYTPRMSEVPSDINGYREDYFKIWNPAVVHENGEIGDWADGAKMFSVKPVNDGGNNTPATRYGYYVPSFGVSFSRQNNSLFKSINLNSTTPLVTSASINALSKIAMAGSGAQHKAAFVGQDLYPVYSNYSYICEIEMMGDAQIQPLMYFQLMNIPMFSGVYMIFNVTHTITPGNMVTKFKGMKLSRNPLPYNSSWYMFRPDQSSDESYEENEYEDSNYEYTGDGTGAGEYYNGEIDYSSLGTYEIKFKGDTDVPKGSLCNNDYEQRRKYYILRCMDYFTSRELTIAQAGGIVGNFMNEGLPCYAQSWANDADSKSFGLSQMFYARGVYGRYMEYCGYDKERNKKNTSDVKERGGKRLDWREINSQLSFIYDIVKGKVGGYPELVKHFSNKDITYDQAAFYFAAYYENCGSSNNKQLVKVIFEGKPKEVIRNGCKHEGGTTVIARKKSAKEAIDLFKQYIKNKSKGSLGDGKPLLVGDKWAVDMAILFNRFTGGISAATQHITPVKLREQIKNNIKNNPQYILLYYGDPNVYYLRDEKFFEDALNKCCEDALSVPSKDKIRVYIPSIIGNGYSNDEDVRHFNLIIDSVCKNNENAVHIQLDSNDIQNINDVWEKTNKNMKEPNTHVYNMLFNIIMGKIQQNV